MKHEGSCWCGDIKFSCNEPVYIANCHCEDCRKSAGAAVVAWAVFQSSDVDLDETALKTISLNEGVTRGFCPNCGTSLSYKHLEHEGILGLTVGAFDNPEPLKPVSDDFLCDHVSWVAVSDETQKHQGSPLDG